MLAISIKLVAVQYRYINAFTGISLTTYYRNINNLKTILNKKNITLHDYAIEYEHDIPALIQFLNTNFKLNITND